jgi:hypothetical protein
MTNQLLEHLTIILEAKGLILLDWIYIQYAMAQVNHEVQNSKIPMLKRTTMLLDLGDAKNIINVILRC